MAVDRKLVQIRERSYLDLLDLALVLFRQKPLVLGLSAALGAAPWAALYAYLASREDFPAYFLIVLIAFAAPWATAPLTIMLGGLMFGERPKARRVSMTLLRKLPSMFLYQGLLRAVLVLSGFLLGWLIPTQFGFLDEVILLERGRGEKAARSVWKRCTELASGRAGELFAQFLGNLFFAALFLTAFRWAAEAVVDALFRDLTWSRDALDDSDKAMAFFAWFFDLRGWSAQSAIWLLITFFGVVRFLTYIDQRIRLEGWEVELRLRAVGAAMEEAERW